MDEQETGSASEPKSAEDRIAELEAKLNAVSRDYSASSREAKRLAEQVTALQSAYEAPRQDVPQRNSAGQRLAEAAIPLDAFDERVDERARQIVAQQFEPLMRGVQARQTMVGKYKDYAKWESDIGELLNTDAEFQQTYQRVFQADPVAAFELAYFRLGESRRKSHGNRNGGSLEDQAEAQIPTSRSGDTRRAPQGSDDVARAREEYRKNPSRQTAEALFKSRMHTVIPDSFLNQ